MFSHIKRVFRWIHEYFAENHPTIAVTGSLIILSYLSYHLPAHIHDSKFKTLEELFVKVQRRLGKGSIEAIFASIGTVITFFVIFLHLPYSVYHEVQDLFGFRQRRRYLDAQFTKLLSECHEIQEIFEDNRSLENLHKINELLIECMDRFKSDTDRIVTPTLEEFFSNPNEFYEVPEEDFEREPAHLSEDSLRSLLNP